MKKNLDNRLFSGLNALRSPNNEKKDAKDSAWCKYRLVVTELFIIGINHLDAEKYGMIMFVVIGCPFWLNSLQAESESDQFELINIFRN